LTIGADMTLTEGMNVSSGGSLTFGADVTLAANVSVASGATLNMQGHTATIDGLNGGGLVDNTSPSTTSVLAVGGNGASSAFSGTIQNSGSLATLSLRKIGAGAVTLTGPNTYTGLSVVQAGTLELGASAQNAVLAIGGADVQGGKIVFDYPSQAAAIKADLTTSYATGFALTNGSKFHSSTATGKYGLGWADDGSAKVTVAYTLYGDANLDYSVNGTDLNAVLSNYNQSGASWSNGDFNYDGMVNGTDLNTVLSNYNQHVAVGAAVPEPSTLLLTFAALAGLLAYVSGRRK
jgi:fibronectin-binding autotransporter adhesin